MTTTLKSFPAIEQDLNTWLSIPMSREEFFKVFTSKLIDCQKAGVQISIYDTHACTEDKITMLEIEKELAVENEAYEKAAELRDQILALQSDNEVIRKMADSKEKTRFVIDSEGNAKLIFTHKGVNDTWLTEMIGG